MNIEEEITVSIITVVYNNYSSIKHTIESVLGQNYQKFEYIIIDGQSTDGTIEIIQQYQESITKFISEKDQGIYDAMNKGVRAAKGRYCLFMNSGDIFANSEVLTTFSGLLNESKNDIVYGDVITLNSAGMHQYKSAEPPCNKHRMYFCHQSAFAATKILLKHPFDLNYKMSADFKFFKLCYINKYHFAYLTKAVAIFNLQGISKTQRVRGLRENIRIINEVDTGLEKIRLLLRILPSYLTQKIRMYIKQTYNKNSFF